MKVIVFNCSPKAEKANTALILNPFLKGMEKAGGKVVLASKGGFWEMDNFDPLLVHRLSSGAI